MNDGNSKRNFTPGMIANLKLQVARQMKKDPEYAKQVIEKLAALKTKQKKQDDDL